jgi:molybdate transport system substrate-binding protein
MRRCGTIPRVLGAMALMLALLLFVAGCGESTPATTTAPSTVASATEPAASEGSTTTTLATPSTSSPTTAAQPRELFVSAAAGLKGAFTKIGELFDQKYNAKTSFNFAAAGVLQNQIEGGAPADVFASADPKNMNALVEKKLADASSVQTIAGNEIVLIIPAGSTAPITGFADLAKQEIKKVATGNPDSTPLGVATLKILPALNMEAAVKPKLVYSETVSQTLAWVAAGEVDAGIVWTSEAQTGGAKVKAVAIAEHSWYGTARFVIGTVSNSKSKDLAQDFIDFVVGPTGQAILQSYGFQKPPAD